PLPSLAYLHRPEPLPRLGRRRPRSARNGSSGCAGGDENSGIRASSPGGPMSRRPYALLLAVLPVLAGCGHVYLKPCDDGPPWRPAETVPDEMKACVYVFLFDSFDPFAVGQLADLRDHLHRLGFGKTYY